VTAGALVAGRVAAQKAAKVAAKSLAPGFGQLFRQELAAAAIPAAMSLMYYAPAYYDPEDPVGSISKIAALSGTDLLGSALLGAGARKLSMAVRPGTTVKTVSPQYTDDLASMGLGVGATDVEIDKAKRRMLGEINAGAGDHVAKAAQAVKTKEFADSLKSRTASSIFTEQYKPSRLADVLSYGANYGFTLGGMRAVEEGLINAGALKPSWVQQYEQNPGTISQDQVIAQQSQGRAEAGVPNQAIMSPGTMSQLSAIEIQQLQNELLAQAASEYEELSGMI
jgi:hypothetical protein